MKRFYLVLASLLGMACFAGPAFCDIQSNGVRIPPVTIPQVRILNLQIQQIRIPQITIPSITPSFSIRIPSVSIPSFGLRSSIGSSFSSVSIPNFAQTFMGPQVNMGNLYGIRFDDIYIANPDDNKNAVRVAALAKKDLARFGLASPVQSPLEALLFPQAKEEKPPSVAYYPR